MGSEEEVRLAQVELRNTENDNCDEKLLAATSNRVLDEEKQGILFEILKCAVCLEIPKETQNLQVCICEKGHHFCSPCRKKLRTCAICRGRLFIGRNFVVEELITKLGAYLGITKVRPPVPDAPPPYSPGTYPCLHECHTSFTCGKMLSHVRTEHTKDLIDNMRSNPYTGKFEFMHNITLSANIAFKLSLQISDMGLFTVTASVSEGNLLAWIYVMGDNSIASLFRYSLGIRVLKHDLLHQEISVLEAPVMSSRTPRDAVFATGKCLRIHPATLTEFMQFSDKFQISFSIWKSKERKVDKDVGMFHSDRKSRRNRNRNFRRKRLKERLRKALETNPEERLLDAISILSINSNGK